MRYYLLSLKWTHPRDEYFTFLRPAGQGVNFIKCYFGHYDLNQACAIMSNASELLGIPEIVIDRLAIPVMIGEDYRQVIPITDETLKAIGISRDNLKGRSKSDYSDVDAG